MTWIRLLQGIPIAVAGRSKGRGSEVEGSECACDAPQAEGLVIREFENVVVRQCLFRDINTRGILAADGNRLSVRHNVFFRVGTNTSSADIAIGADVIRWTVEENLLAGNVDGVVTSNPGAEALIARNLYPSPRSEDAIDLKGAGAKSTESAETVVRQNVIYAQQNRGSAITVQNGSDDVCVRFNVIRGLADDLRDAGEAGIVVRGRDGDVERIEIAANWLDGQGAQNNPGIVVKHNDGPRGADVRDVDILNNVFTGTQDPAISVWSHADEPALELVNITVYNNIFDYEGMPDPVLRAPRR